MFDLYNEWPSNMSVGWNISDLGISNSSYLNQSEFVMVIIAENYSSQGHKKPEIQAYSGSMLSAFADSFRIFMVELFDLQVLKQSVESTVTELFIRSNSGNKTIDWKFHSGEEVINSTQSVSTNESVMVLIETNYSSSGIYSVNASINSTQFNDEASGVVIS